MPRLLLVQSSPRFEESVTRALCEEFVQRWIATHPAFELEVLDLARDPLPHFGPDAINGFTEPDGQRSPAGQEALELSERLICQVEAAKVLVIGCPMYNFTIPTQLKTWLDHLTRAGRTFEERLKAEPRGLLWQKRAFVILSRGGEYGVAPASATDFQEPLLRAHLRLIGIENLTFIRAEGQLSPRARESVGRAREAIAWITS